MAAKKAKPMIKKDNKFLYLSLGLVAVALVLLVIYLALPASSGNRAITPTNYSTCSIGDNPILGDENAPVTIIEYSDFSCPFCALAAENSFPKIVEEYVNTGKVKIIFKYFPGHGAGLAAHEVGLALNEQCLFWQFHDLAFANQNDVGDISKMKDLAKSIGADMAKLELYLSNTTNVNNILAKDMQDGQAAGIQGTPSFLINDQLIAGAQPFSEFKKIIDAELNSGF